MGKKLIEYNLKGDYLNIYHKSDLYLSLRKDYIKDADPTIIEVADLLTQAQDDNKPIEDIISTDLIAFLKQIETAFNPRPYYTSLYITHIVALIFSIISSLLLKILDKTLIDFYLYFIIFIFGEVISLYILRHYVGKKINEVNFNKVRFIAKLKTLFFALIFGFIVFFPSTNINIPISVFYLLLGISLIPIIVIQIKIAFKQSKNKKTYNNTKESGDFELTAKELFINKLENNFIKKNIKRTQKNLKPLSDVNVVNILSRKRKVILFLYPLITIGYFVQIGYIIYAQVQGGFDLRLTFATSILVLVMLFLFAVLTSTKHVSKLIYYLKKRDLTIFEKGAIPKKI